MTNALNQYEYVFSPSQVSSKLVSGGDDHFLPKLKEAINWADSIDLAVSFIRLSGINYLKSSIVEAIERGVKVRILTGDYLKVTEPRALNQILQLKDFVALENNNLPEVRIYESAGQSFHPKVYIFIKGKNNNIENGSIYIGSSNISKSALTDGIEWNIRVDHNDNHEQFQEICERFNTLWDNPKCVQLTREWLDNYEKSYKPEVQTDVNDETEIPEPHPIQKEALTALQNARMNGQKRGLVVLATGLGKTWLSAFDAQQMKARRVLFVAHRDEILNQAIDTYERINPDAHIGKFTGTEKEINADILFASVQSLGKAKSLKQFPIQSFDYIIVDEFHHAQAATYRRVINYFSPDFLLGLTATPDRTDQRDVVELCDNNIVFQIDLIEGIRQDRLSPFVYHGIDDYTVEYSAIPWRSGKFDITELETKVATEERAAHVLKEWREYKQERTMAFCVSRSHADFMADYFKKEGIKAVSVHSTSMIRRNVGIDGLNKGSFEVIFSVDLFNEGIDVPNIDTVMMLRPTESKILFLQQLGRGLRKADGKKHLKILDFIGNHKSFLQKPQALLGIGDTKQEMREYIEKARDGDLDLPKGCFINYDLKVLDFMQQMVQGSSNIDDTYDYLFSTRGRRPTASEMFQVGCSFNSIRRDYGSWFGMVKAKSHLTSEEKLCIERYDSFFSYVEKTKLTKSFKMVTLEAMLELNGFASPPSTKELSKKSLEIFERRPALQNDIHEKFGNSSNISTDMVDSWHSYWLSNPINALIGGNTSTQDAFFEISGEIFATRLILKDDDQPAFESMLQELINLRLVGYNPSASTPDEIICKVITNKTNPIIMLNETYRHCLPHGESSLAANGVEFNANFVKIALNVVKDKDGKNILPEILRTWFGKDAGQPGRRDRVVFTNKAEQWEMKPIIKEELEEKVLIPFYPTLSIACGHFREGLAGEQETISLPDYVITRSMEILPNDYFVCRASGNSMNGGKNPIKNGDYLVLKWITPNSAGSITGKRIVVRNLNNAGDDEFVLRKVEKKSPGNYQLIADNPEYEPFDAEEEMEQFAWLEQAIDPLEIALHKPFMRNEIPLLFDEEFIAATWQTGHISLRDGAKQILLVNLDKKGLQAKHKYLDYFISPQTFHWQSQNNTKPENKRGRGIVNQVAEGHEIHLFVRKSKLGPDKKAAPFIYCGNVVYQSHEGQNPMSVIWKLDNPLSNELFEEFSVR
jgi:superfamily II DNA or RNA helicase/SOS-response transcriptional repressor LexA